MKDIFFSVGIFFARNFIASPQKSNGQPLRTTTLEKPLFSHSYNF